MDAQRGVTLITLGLSLVFLIGILGLAVDLGMLYVGRSEAQRAADAAALAGAYQFSQSACTEPGGDCSADTGAQTAATAQADAAAESNYVLTKQVQGSEVTVKFTYPVPNEPQVTVNLYRGNIPLLFAKIFGQTIASVTASATAEATQANTVGCVVPFLIADCQTVDGSMAQYDACPYIPNTTTYASYFIDPTSGVVDSKMVGQQILLHTATSNGSVIPSQWYLAGISGTGTGTPSSSLLRTNIEYCSQDAVTCGANGIAVPAIPGNRIGPVNQGIDTLIGATGEGPNNNQDVLAGFSSDGTPIIDSASGVQVSQSASVVTVPVYSDLVASGSPLSPPTTTLSPGNVNTVYVVGFAELFINYVSPPGNQASLPAPCNTFQGPFNDGPVCATVLKVTGCNGAPVGGNATPVPVRLIQGPG
jgi:Flp pilus assembly protein TadG